MLIVKGNRWGLSVPVAHQVAPPKTSDVDRVLAVDVGINTAATWAVVDSTGTGHDRGCLDRSDEDRAYRLMARIRSAAASHTRHGSRLSAGFKAADHRRLKQMASNAAHQISRQLVNKALDSGCQAVIVENTSRVGARGAGAAVPRCVSVSTAGSIDGSGKVRRDAGNVSRCTFATGKHYHAGLNAAHNIAAHGLVFYELSPTKPRERL